MHLIFLDTEMTGLDPEKHRVIEIAYQIIDAKAGKRLIQYETVVMQPPEVWGLADPESLKITGFSWEEILQGKPEPVVASEIANDFNHAGIKKENSVFVCQNPSFDRIFFSQLIHNSLQLRYGWPYHWLDLASMYWAIQLKVEKKSHAEIKGKGLSKNQIASHYGIEPEPFPHRAMQGVSHLISCYEAMFGAFGPS